jgi:hypothetical protein
MSYYSYTILESTNPELLSSGSTFVKESNSELLKIKESKAHFLTWKATMDNEIIKLSLKHSGETFTAECHWANEYYNRIIYLFEYRNGKCKELQRCPGYMFFLVDGDIPSEEEYSAFRNHVLKYLRRLDIVKKEDGDFIIDKLNNEQDKNGYESFITIVYENDLYKWTAEKTGISYIRVSVEKRSQKLIC